MEDLANGGDLNLNNYSLEQSTQFNSMSFNEILYLKITDMNERHYCIYFGTIGLFFLLTFCLQIIFFDLCIQNTQEFIHGVKMAVIICFTSIMTFIILFLIIEYMCKIYLPYQNFKIYKITTCLIIQILLTDVILSYFYGENFIEMIKIYEI